MKTKRAVFEIISGSVYTLTGTRVQNFYIVGQILWAERCWVSERVSQSVSQSVSE